MQYAYRELNRGRPTSARVRLGLPNDWQISCRRSSSRPHKLTLPLLGHTERGARAELLPSPACRLHLRVRRRGYGTSTRSKTCVTWAGEGKLSPGNVYATSKPSPRLSRVSLRRAPYPSYLSMFQWSEFCESML